MAQLATRWWCVHRGTPAAGLTHSQGTGRPPASGKCRYCKGGLVSETGTWGIFAWTGDGRYPAEAARETRVREGAAQALADKLNDTDPQPASPGGWVVRWIPIGN